MIYYIKYNICILALFVMPSMSAFDIFSIMFRVLDETGENSSIILNQKFEAHSNDEQDASSSPAGFSARMLSKAR